MSSTANQATLDKPTGAEAEVVLEATGIDMSFGGNKALSDVSIYLRRAQWTGLIGPNGSGKTTLLNVLSGLYLPSGGQVKLEGVDVTKKSPRKLARAGIVRTFQHPQFAPTLTVMENVLLGSDLRRRRIGLPKKTFTELNERAWHLLEVFGAAEFAGHTPLEAPYGVRKIAEIARAVLADPAVLLLDEPAAGLSREERSEFIDSLRVVRTESPNLAVCLIEHDVRLVAAACENMQALNFGKVLARGTSDEVLDNDAVKEAYLGKSANKVKGQQS